MIKLQFKLPQALISRGFTRRTVFHAPAFQQKGINRLMDTSNPRSLMDGANLSDARLLTHSFSVVSQIYVWTCDCAGCPQEYNTFFSKEVTNSQVFYFYF